MAKLKKARPDVPAPAAPSPAPPCGSPSSSRRAPSLLSASTARSAPLALRTVGSPALAPPVSASSVEAHGELIEGDGSEAETASRTHRSRSPTSSSIHSHRRTASPSSPRSPFLHHRLPSTASTVESYETPGTSPEQPRLAPRVSSFASTLDADSTSSSSALAKLRTRLDSDHVAREAQRIQDEHAHAAGGKLRKKLPRELAVEVAREHVDVETPTEARLGGADGLEGPSRAVGPEEEVVELSGEAAQEDAWLAALEADQRDEELLERDERSVEEHQAAPSSSNSLITAPVRLGWRLASGTVSLGFRTTHSVLSHIPVVSTVIHAAEHVVEGASDTLAARTAPLREYAFPRTPPVERVPAHGRLSSCAPGEPATVPPHVPAKVPPTESSTALVRLSDVPLAPLKVALRAAELSLTVSLASVLVVGAVTGMAWDRARGRPVRTPFGE